MHLLRFRYNSQLLPIFLSENEGKIISLPFQLGKTYEWKIKEKVCIGYRDEKGWHACPNNAINTRQCPTCKARDITKVFTSFEISGYEKLGERLRKEERYLYLATFGERIKVGVSKNPERRTYEQGAEHWVIISKLPTERAYEMEEIISQRFNLPDKIKSREKLNAGKEKENEGRKILEEILEQLKRDRLIGEYIHPTKIYTHHYTLPEKYVIKEAPNGELVGWKGEFLFFKNSKVEAVNMKKLEGDVIEMNGPGGIRTLDLRLS